MNPFQRVRFTALSLLTPAQSRENLIALCRISFQLIGMVKECAPIDYRRQCPEKACPESWSFRWIMSAQIPSLDAEQPSFHSSANHSPDTSSGRNTFRLVLTCRIIAPARCNILNLLIAEKTFSGRGGTRSFEKDNRNGSSSCSSRASW